MLGLLFQIGVVAAVTFLILRWFQGDGAQQAVTQAAAPRPEDEVSPLKDFRKRTPPSPAGLETETQKERAFKDTPLQDIAIEDVPGVGPITKERLKKHNYISITTAEQLFGFFLYKTSPGVTSSAPRMGRCDEFKTWLTNDCSVRGQEANTILKAFLDKAEKVCIHTAGTEYGRVSELSGSGSGSTTQVYNNKAIQDIAIQEVPGVGIVTADLLKKNKNITNGEQLFGFFLYLGRDAERFKTWLKDECEVRTQVANKIHQTLADTAAKLCTLG